MSDHQCPVSTTPMTPGTYLRKRRVTAGFSIDHVAAGLDVLGRQYLQCCGDAAPWHPSILRRLTLRRRLRAAEENRLLFTLREVERLGLLIRLDPNVYEQLVDLHLAGPDSGLPEPHVCRSCACSFLDPCVDEHGTCGWARLDSGMCTACAALLSGLGPNEVADLEAVA